jgi:ribonuclease P protein component
VVRNRQRRRLRSILRQLSPHVLPGFDILLVLRAGGANATQAELESALSGLMRTAALLVAP